MGVMKFSIPIIIVISSFEGALEWGFLALTGGRIIHLELDHKKVEVLEHGEGRSYM